jgi:hypothetical protein
MGALWMHNSRILFVYVGLALWVPIADVWGLSPLLATSTDEKSNRLRSESCHFCKLAREHGFTEWVIL